MCIAIVGATGMLGQPVTHEFIRAGFTIRIIVRDIVAARQRFPNVDVVTGDLQDVSSLIDALQHVDTVYLNLSIKQNESQTEFHTEAQGLINLIDAARRANVRRIAYLSSIIMRYQGTDDSNWWVFGVKQNAVRLIRESGISYSLFYPSCFMDSINGTQRVGPIVLLVGRSDVQPWYIADHDYGKQIVRAFQLAQDGQNQEYVIQGPEAITQHDAAERFVKAYRREKLLVVTVPAFLMKLGRSFSAQAAYGWHITDALNHYPETFEAERIWLDLGKPETTMEQFAAQ